MFCLFTHYITVFMCFMGRAYCFMESNHQICDVYKSIMFEKLRHCGTFLCQQIFIRCNPESCSEHIKDGANIYLHDYVTLLAPVCDVFLCVCEISNQSTSKQPDHVLDLNNPMPCCIKHDAMPLWY